MGQKTQGLSRNKEMSRSVFPQHKCLARYVAPRQPRPTPATRSRGIKNSKQQNVKEQKSLAQGIEPWLSAYWRILFLTGGNTTTVLSENLFLDTRLQNRVVQAKHWSTGAMPGNQAQRHLRAAGVRARARGAARRGRQWGKKRRA